MTVRIVLEDRALVRVGWELLTLALLGAAVLTGLALVGGGAPAWGLVVSLALAGLYGWFGTGAARVARRGSGELRLDGGHLVVDSPAVLDEPVPRLLPGAALGQADAGAPVRRRRARRGAGGVRGAGPGRRPGPGPPVLRARRRRRPTRGPPAAADGGVVVGTLVLLAVVTWLAGGAG